MTQVDGHDHPNCGQRNPFCQLPFFFICAPHNRLFKSLIGFELIKDVSADQNGEANTTSFVEVGGYPTRNSKRAQFFDIKTLSRMQKLFFRKNQKWTECVAVVFYLVGVCTFFTLFEGFVINYPVPDIRFGAELLMLFFFAREVVRFIPLNKWRGTIKSLNAFPFALLGFMVCTYDSVELVFF